MRGQGRPANQWNRRLRFPARDELDWLKRVDLADGEIGLIISDVVTIQRQFDSANAGTTIHSRESVLGPFATCRGTPRMSASWSRPELAGRQPKRRD